MFTLLRRQRRRLCVCGLLVATAFAANMILFLDFDPSAPLWARIALGMLGCGIAGVVGFALGAVGAAFIVLVFPGQRAASELLAIMAFATLLIAPIAPSTAPVMSQANPTLGALAPIAWFVMVMAVNAMLNGTALDRSRFRTDLKERHRFRLPLPPEEAWKLLVPGSAPAAQHWDPLFYSIAAQPGQADRYDVLYTHGLSLFEHQEIEFLERNAPHAARYEIAGLAIASGLTTNKGVFDLEIQGARSGGCTIVLRSVRTGLLPRLAWNMWLDDTLADNADYIRAQQSRAPDWSMTGRYRRDVGRADVTYAPDGSG